MGLSKKRILITGGSGFLGSYLSKYLADDSFSVYATYRNNLPVNRLSGVEFVQLDLNNKFEIQAIIKEIMPDVVIHAAALTNVDLCEENKDFAYESNIQSTQNLVALVIPSTYFIYISSDSVYDGKNGNYKESDSANPINYYGYTKLMGEKIVRKLSNHLILRINLFGYHIFKNKTSLGEWIISSLKNKIKINGFTDAVFSPLYIATICEIIEKSINLDLYGVFNCGSLDNISKFHFAQEIAKSFNQDIKLISPISVNEINFLANRGHNLSMNSSKLSNYLGIKLPSIKEEIEKFSNDFN